MKLLLATAAVSAVSAASLMVQSGGFEGNWCGSVPFILEMKFDIKSDTAADFDLNVKVSKTEVDCPGTTIAVSGTKLTFPNIMNNGDCIGDKLRGQGKDPSKYSVQDNGDGTLTFNSDGTPPLKLKACKSETAEEPVVAKFVGIMSASNPTHYGDPSGGCMDDEQAIQVQGIDGDFCSPKCKALRCPKDVPSGASAKPQCALQTTTGEKYCALICDPKDEDACGTGTCKPIQGTGLCTYDDR